MGIYLEKLKMYQMLHVVRKWFAKLFSYSF